jgi:hypothetical protein
VHVSNRNPQFFIFKDCLVAPESRNIGLTLIFACLEGLSVVMND